MSLKSDMRIAYARCMTPSARTEFVTRLMGPQLVQVECTDCGEPHYCERGPAIITPEEARMLLELP